MPVVSHAIEKFPQRHCIRIFVNFLLDDGRTFRRRHQVLSESEIPAQVARLQARLEKRVAELDGFEAADKDLPIAHRKEAQVKDVLKAYLMKGLDAETKVEAWHFLNKAYTFIQAQGWAPTQVKTQLDISDKTWDKLVNRYNYCVSNQAIIEAYEALEGR